MPMKNLVSYGHGRTMKIAEIDLDKMIPEDIKRLRDAKEM